MVKGSTVPVCAGLCITNGYRAWRPTQTWLAERIRMVASRLFAQLEAEGGGESGTLPVAVHKAAITAQISKIFGALFDETAPHLSGSWLVDLLAQLGDLGDIGHGYYIPRESRIVRLTSKWGRIAGGLPIELSEHSDEGVQSVLDETVGRLLILREGFTKHDHGTEHSEVYKWQTNTVEQIHAELCEGLPEHAASRPPEEASTSTSVGCPGRMCFNCVSLKLATTQIFFGTMASSDCPGWM
jgi:hypothetical protein